MSPEFGFDPTQINSKRLPPLHESGHERHELAPKRDLPPANEHRQDGVDIVSEGLVALNYVVQRHSTLVDRQFIRGLTPHENEELSALGATLDEMNAPFYDPVIKGLRTVKEQEKGI